VPTPKTKLRVFSTMSLLNTSSFGYYEGREYHTIKGNLAYRRGCTHFAKKFSLVYNIHSSVQVITSFLESQQIYLKYWVAGL